MTYAETLALQQKLNQLGWKPPLKEDGVPGPKTLAAQRALLHAREDDTAPDEPIPASFPRWVLEVAKTQVGERELVPNGGPMIDQYLQAVGLKRGQPYCMAGPVWCGDRAANKLGVKNPMPRTGGTQYWLQLAREKGWEIAKRHAQAGDICIQRHTATTGHAFIIEEVVPDSKGDGKIWRTIEFNSNSSGSRDGEGVVRGRRGPNDPKLVGVIRLPEVVK